jgi:hypothetical protein
MWPCYSQDEIILVAKLRMITSHLLHVLSGIPTFGEKLRLRQREGEGERERESRKSKLMGL